MFSKNDIIRLLSELLLILVIFGCNTINSKVNIGNKSGKPRLDPDNWDMIQHEINDSDSIVALKLSHDASPVVLEKISKLQHLKKLDLSRTRVNNEQLRHIEDIQSLNCIDISHTIITDSGLKYIQGLRNVQELYLPSYISNCGLAYLSKMSNLKVIDLTGANVSDEGFEAFRNNKKLETIISTCNDYDDGELTHICNIKSLRNLHIYGEFTEAGLKNIPKLSDLRKLKIGFIEKNCMKYIYKLKKLRVLAVRGEIADNEIVNINKLKCLCILDLTQTEVSDNSLVSIANLKKLTKLDISCNNKIKGDNMEYLKYLPNLTNLYLRNTALDDGCVEDLLHIPNLNTLDISGTNITEHGKSILRKHKLNIIKS